MFRDNIVFQEYIFSRQNNFPTFKISSLFQAYYNAYYNGAKFEMELVITCSTMTKNANQPYF